MDASFGIRKTISGSVPAIPFGKIVRDVLGNSYELSLVLCGDTLAQRMNKHYRKKTYRPNVLSFPISKNAGEIFLNIRCAEREAKRYGVSVRSRTALLYVHGLFHLKGLGHGAAMERREQSVLKKYRLA